MDVLDFSEGNAAPVANMPLVRIQLDPEVQVAAIGGRLHLQVRGRVLDAARVAEIVLIADGELVGRMSCDSPAVNRAAAAGIGFAFVLARWPTRAKTRIPLILEVRLEDGRSHREPFVLIHDELQRAASIEECPATAGMMGMPPDPPIRVYVEEARRDGAGHIRAAGWVVSRTRLVAIQVFGVGDRIGLAQLGGARADVGQVHRAYPGASRSGFTFASRAVGGGPVERIVIRALALEGISQDEVVSLAPAAGPDPIASPDSAAELGPPVHLNCEEATISPAGLLTVSGWVVCAGGVEAVAAWLGDVHLGEVELGLPRDDVGQRFPEILSARGSGFRLRVADAKIAGECLGIVARSVGGRTASVTQVVRRAADAPVQSAPEQAAAARFRLELDTPNLVGGAVPEPVGARLVITGWTVAQSGIASIDILIDGQPAGRAHHGVPRQDVAAAMPNWPESLWSGFLFSCPPRLLKAGSHEATLRIVARDGQVFGRGFAFTVRPDDAETRSTIRRRLSRAEFDLQTAVLERLRWRPAFRLLIPLRAPDEVEAASLTLDALHRQRYVPWEALLIAADRETATRAAVLSAATPRTRVIGPDRLDQALDGDALFALLGPGDLPGVDALIEIAVATGCEQEAEFFSCDESRISPATGEREPFRKPCFSPDLLLHTNYIGRFWCARGSLLARVGATAGMLLERGEYDLVLRCTEAARAVHHVPRLLCERGATEESALSERDALAAAMARRGIVAEIAAGRVARSYRLRRVEPVPGLVSVLIPTCAANGHIKTCIETLRARGNPGRIEIVCIENIGAADAHWRPWLRANTDRLISTGEAFNWSRFGNRCAAEARGEFLLFLNDDTEIIDPGWLDAMLAELARPGVGIVGPRLLYPDGRVQYAGMFLAEPGLARHAFRFAEPNDPGYFGLAVTTRNVIAVTGACMLVRRTLFKSLGGFDEAHDVINNDLDFCLRAHAAGHAIVYTPEASLIHHEMASRGGLAERFDAERFEGQWRGVFLRGDPFHSPNLARGTDDLVPEEEPAQIVCAGQPLFARDEIARIVVLKLDHIGDFLTAIPALHRLRALFPSARITMLASLGVRELALQTGAVDAFIGFEFFHARSALGQRELGSEDFAALAGRLAPERFDLAIDLRKHLDTREVLRCTGARLLAGFDHLGQFGWLDVSLDWEGDRALQAKRSHVSADLLNLVEALGTASRPDCRAPSMLGLASAPPSVIPPELQAFFDRPVVCLHPGVGNAMRQWPAGRFADLIDMLVVGHGARAMLIGGPDERALADAILAEVADPSAVRSVVGDVELADLPGLIGACTLFVGNNSGPQHIAASLGVPTVGIHSGVVDAAEWAPLGPLAVAVRRDMACSPCYLNRPEDCHRNLACLTGLQPAAVFAACARFLARPGALSEAHRRSVP